MAVRTGRDGLTHIRTYHREELNENCIVSVEMYRDEKNYIYYSVQVDESIEGFQMEQDLIFTKTYDKATYFYNTIIRIFNYGVKKGKES